MKRIIFTLIALLAMNSQMAYAQSWDTVGSQDFSAGEALCTSIAIDGNGTPYVAYYDGGNGGKATVMKYNGSSWVTVGAAGFSDSTAYYTSIAIWNDTPYVVYEDGGNNLKATVMKYNGSSWVRVGTAGFSDSVATYTSIAINGSGTPYVVYEDYATSNFGATVMKYNGSSWVVVGIVGFTPGASIFSDLTAQYTSIAIDGSGTPYVAYCDGSSDDAYSGAATVMKYNGSSWVYVGNPGFSGSFATGGAQYTSIAIDSGGTPYVVYEDFTNSDAATVMKYVDTSWVTVGSAGFSISLAAYTSIAIDRSGTPYVVYQNGGYIYPATVMKYNGSSWVTVGSADFTLGGAEFTSIAINGDGTPYIVYFDCNDGGRATVMEYDTSTGSISGIGESNIIGPAIQIYPNPLSTTVHIKAPGKVNVTILNVVGQVMLEQQNATDIDMSGVANGIYIIKVYDENNMLLKTEKLVKDEE